MEQGIITGVLAVSLAFLNPSSTTYIQPASQEIKEMRDYRVESGDSLTSIAESIYGSTDFWTTIWNDNPTIKSPNLIEEGDILKIRNTKPTEAEELNEVLSKKVTIKPVAKAFTSPTPVQAATQAQAIQAAPSSSPKSLTDAQILFLGQCEAGMIANRNTGNGYYGAFQFSYGTWKSMGTAYERADLAPIEVQIDAVQRLLQRSSIFTQFPGCARKMQAQGML